MDAARVPLECGALPGDEHAPDYRRLRPPVKEQPRVQALEGQRRRRRWIPRPFSATLGALSTSTGGRHVPYPPHAGADVMRTLALVDLGQGLERRPLNVFQEGAA